MRFSSFLPLAIVAAASVAVARPVDDYMFAARSDSEVALSERDLQIISHFAREYLAARSDADLYLSARSDFEDGDLFEREYLEPGTFDEYEKAFLEWNARMRKMDHAGKKILNKNEAAYNKHQGGSSKSGGLSKLFGKKKA
ncbi:hypothetical protein EVJ58_g7166 [Rhodofomes roseus]|uniref:Uncharacterized protein n=1 Tax=Rhodofomes roseus TaxID=34475 RepID=A0A4Y9Y400_9APHY|nr:hypothetical protein EVJ58_g7166 [Rhodofomes roseus]